MARVLSVGQCGLDHGSISRMLRQSAGAEVEAADTFPEAVGALRGGSFDLVLVNRISDYDGSSGLDLIRMITADPALAAVPVMLVSNYPDAQAQAEALGALPGFGKADVRGGKAAERVKVGLAARRPDAPNPA